MSFPVAFLPEARDDIDDVFRVPPHNAHPLKSQSFSANVIHMAMADGSVRSSTGSVTDPAWSAGETPRNLETLRPDDE